MKKTVIPSCQRSWVFRINQAGPAYIGTYIRSLLNNSTGVYTRDTTGGPDEIGEFYLLPIINL